MNFGDEQKMYEECLKTKQKWEEIIENNIPFPCKKCGIEKTPKEFVKHYLENSYVGRYQFLHECKECKKQRIYEKRNKDRYTIQGAMYIIHKYLLQGAKKRNIEFNITKEDLLELWYKQNGKCYYTGYNMEYNFVNEKEGGLSEKSMYQLSYDRINNNYGYTKDNIVLSTTLANKMKGILNYEEFINTCNDIVNYNT